jgi:hypothetical protein
MNIHARYVNPIHESPIPKSKIRTSSPKTIPAARKPAESFRFRNSCILYVFHFGVGIIPSSVDLGRRNNE